MVVVRLTFALEWVKIFLVGWSENKAHTAVKLRQLRASACLWFNLKHVACERKGFSHCTGTVHDLA